MLSITVNDNSGNNKLLYYSISSKDENIDLYQAFKCGRESLPNIRIDVFKEKNNEVFSYNFSLDYFNKVIKNEEFDLEYQRYDIIMQSDFLNGNIDYTASEEASAFIKAEKSNENTKKIIIDKFYSFVNSVIISAY